MCDLAKAMYGDAVVGNIASLEFEVKGWDVFLQYHTSKVLVYVNENLKKHESWDSAPVNIFTGPQKDTRAILIEVKPTIGDDYPTVLRDMKARWCDGVGKVLLVQDFTSQVVSRDQFVEIFRLSGILVVFLEEVHKDNPVYVRAVCVECYGRSSALHVEIAVRSIEHSEGCLVLGLGV